ncbi:Wadjet anti-phage system protein JetD domain-containing protein [Luteimonas sp. MHLX1A]|uniref:Wadjet anti-phage system protein JetD domain-containing protein n=1 Tax=Alterluteimonas muca TaxID=2878684 RepID=UPI001E5A34EF|nr:DUF2220 family protein [Luteimonas sp. MHLX1A]
MLLEMRSPMRTPEQVRDRLTVIWRRRWTDWLGGAGEWPLSLPLDPPTEAQASANWSTFARWVETWQGYAGPGHVRRATRAWSRMGSQAVPTHVEFASAADVAQTLGSIAAAEFRQADARFTERLAAWPDLEVSLRDQAAWLQALADEDYARAVRVFDWLSAHPGCGLYARQLPVAGVDTKWLERHAAPIAALLAARLSLPKGPLATVAGLAVDPPKRRIRLLDPAMRERYGGLSDLTVRLDEFAALDLGAQVVLVVENLQSVLACEELAGGVVIAGGGFAATELARLPWLRDVPLLYWGDIDIAGFQILSALRQHLPQARSCLMDESTLMLHRTLWSVDPHPPRVTGLGYLTPEESTVAQGLVDGRWGHGVRLEQERIAWPHAWTDIVLAANAAMTDQNNRAVPLSGQAKETA